MHFTSKFLFGALLATGLGLAAIPASSFAQKPPPPPGGKGAELNESKIASSGAREIVGEVWVDNWFKLYINGAPLLEDSVSITTERSFNAERLEFNADLPMTIAFEFRDFMENETGLEYIGTRKQQMGDGGAIAQFRDRSNGQLLAATGSDWRCLTVQSAPAQSSCERERDPDVSQANCAETRISVPDNWMSPGFDDSAWPPATIHTERDVRPKDGYDRVSWEGSAKLIWGADLQKDNILYCRVTVDG
ncbi:MAG: PEBP family protein [Roseibium sp.]|uniref:PEBP family protein n=1 Tax=Roseibium sp. TaxID=1936156 RepID=UPI001B17DF6D|nr:PEBP family protein [Roseibium sp.]MBO6890612.1 PEBP family protein [Roseibium sp.]MBO6930125.1 PEBP family protein [Roseibium sp.]